MFRRSMTRHTGYDMPMIVAHRGGAGLRPENTLAACAHALELGAEGLEIDVRPSSDGEMVVFHDAVPDPGHVRSDGGHKLAHTPPPVRELPFRELRAFDVGYPRASAPGATGVPGERIPALRELLHFLESRPRPPLLMIEIKTDFETAAPLDPLALTDAVLRVLGRRSAFLLSFDWRCLRHAMQSVPADRCVFLTAPEAWRGTSGSGDAPWFAGHAPGRHGGSAVAAIRALGGRNWGAHHSELTPATVTRAREAGLSLAAWTVNEPDEMKRMRALGVAYLVTDYPDLALALRGGASIKQE